MFEVGFPTRQQVPQRSRNLSPSSSKCAQVYYWEREFRNSYRRSITKPPTKRAEAGVLRNHFSP